MANAARYSLQRRDRAGAITSHLKAARELMPSQYSELAFQTEAVLEVVRTLPREGFLMRHSVRNVLIALRGLLLHVQNAPPELQASAAEIAASLNEAHQLGRTFEEDSACACG